MLSTDATWDDAPSSGDETPSTATWDDAPSALVDADVFSVDDPEANPSCLLLFFLALEMNSKDAEDAVSCNQFNRSSFWIGLGWTEDCCSCEGLSPNSTPRELEGESCDSLSAEVCCIFERLNPDSTPREMEGESCDWLFVEDWCSYEGLSHDLTPRVWCNFKGESITWRSVEQKKRRHFPIKITILEDKQFNNNNYKRFICCFSLRNCFNTFWKNLNSEDAIEKIIKNFTGTNFGEKNTLVYIKKYNIFIGMVCVYKQIHHKFYRNKFWTKTKYKKIFLP